MIVRFRGFELDPHLRELRREGQRLPVQKKVLDLLLYLIRFRGRVVSRDALLSRAWGREYQNDSLMLKVHIARLREKLGDDAQNPRYIFTERGIGYRFAKAKDAGK